MLQRRWHNDKPRSTCITTVWLSTKRVQVAYLQSTPVTHCKHLAHYKVKNTWKEALSNIKKKNYQISHTHSECLLRSESRIRVVYRSSPDMFKTCKIIFPLSSLQHSESMNMQIFVILNVHHPCVKLRFRVSTEKWFSGRKYRVLQSNKTNKILPPRLWSVRLLHPLGGAALPLKWRLLSLQTDLTAPLNRGAQTLFSVMES